MATTVSYTFNATTNPTLRATLVRSTDGAIIPCDLANKDYQAFLEWLKDNPPPAGFDGPTN